MRHSIARRELVTRCGARRTCELGVLTLLEHRLLWRAAALAKLRAPEKTLDHLGAVETVETIGRRNPRALRTRGRARQPANAEQAQARPEKRRAANLRGAQETLRARQRRAQPARRDAEFRTRLVARGRPAHRRRRRG